MFTQQQISDHLEITRILQLYFAALDSKRYDLLDQVFALNARADYKVANLRSGLIYSRELIAHLRTFAEGFVFIQHLMGHPLIELAGDTASSTMTVRSFYVQNAGRNGGNPWIVYGTYEDSLCRTEAGWRIQKRIFRSLHIEGKLLPPGQIQLPPVTR